VTARLLRMSFTERGATVIKIAHFAG